MTEPIMISAEVDVFLSAFVKSYGVTKFLKTMISPNICYELCVSAWSL